MAKSDLAIPVTSAASESVSSVGSDIITKKRNRLGVENIKRLLCMRDLGVIEGVIGVDVDRSDEIEPESWEKLYLILQAGVNRILPVIHFLPVQKCYLKTLFSLEP